MSNNDDIDDDDWHNINEEEEDEIIYQMHGGGNCFEDGTTDDFDDEQEVDIVRSYYSNSFNLLEDYCLMIAENDGTWIFNKIQENSSSLKWISIKVHGNASLLHGKW